MHAIVRRAATLLLLLAVPSVAAADVPVQGTLYDGALDPAAGFTFATTAAGYGIALTGDDGPLCELPVEPGAITVVAGPFALSGEAGGGVLVDPALTVVGVSPETACPDLDEAADDCELLASGMAPDCIESIRAGAQALHDQINACVDARCDDYASLIALIEKAPAGGSAIQLSCPIGSISSDVPGLDLAGSLCSGAVTDLWNRRRRLEAFAEQRALCDGLGKELDVLRDGVLWQLDHQGGLSDEDRACWLALAESVMDNLTGLAHDADLAYSHLHDDPVPSCEPDALAESCERCNPQPVEYDDPFVTRRLVAYQIGSDAIGGLVATFRASAARATDRDEAARLDRVAARLARVPREQILEVWYPTDAPIPSATIALRAESDPRTWPQLLLLRPYVRARTLGMTHADRAALQDARALLRAVLGA